MKQICFATKFQELLGKLHSGHVHQCLNDYIKTALKSYRPNAEQYDCMVSL